LAFLLFFFPLIRLLNLLYLIIMKCKPGFVNSHRGKEGSWEAGKLGKEKRAKEK